MLQKASRLDLSLVVRLLVQAATRQTEQLTVQLPLLAGQLLVSKCPEKAVLPYMGTFGAPAIPLYLAFRSMHAAVELASSASRVWQT